MKIALIICLFLCCVFAFVKLGDRIFQKSKIFQSLVNFNNEILCDITLFRYGVLDKLSDLDFVLEKTLKGAKSRLQACEEFECNDSRLNQTERDLVTKYVNELGKSDEINQSKIVNYYEKKFEELYDKYKTEYESRSKLFLKLGVLCGAFVVVLLV